MVVFVVAQAVYAVGCRIAGPKADQVALCKCVLFGWSL